MHRNDTFVHVALVCVVGNDRQRASLKFRMHHNYIAQVYTDTPPFVDKKNMAEDSVASSVGKTVGKATVKAFMSPSLAIVKVIPQGIIELALRGAAVVSHYS